MKKSQQILEQILSLQKDYINAKQEESCQILWRDSVKMSDCDMVGFYNFTKGRLILKALYDGNLLLLKHQGLGNWKISMNLQRNRIIINPSDRERKPFSVNINDQEPICEDNILNIIFNASGEWYIIEDNNEDEILF